jgi:type I restriction enzyme M protein
MISKFNRDGNTSRLAVVLNGSPLFTGSAGSGESEIRRWIIENDWLEAIVALPTDMFYNTGIATYVWIITNQKKKQRKGKIQLIDATAFHSPMRKSLGSKRKQISDTQIEEITRLFGDFDENEKVKVFDNTDFGFRRITVERPLKLNFQTSPERIEVLKQAKPFAKLKDKAQAEIIEAMGSLDAGKVYKSRKAFLKDLKGAFTVAGVDIKTPMLKVIWQALSEKDETAEVCLDKTKKPESDSDLRDNENIPLKEDIEEYFQREVIPHVPDAWIDHDKTKVGYEIPFNRHFYKYVPPRSLEEIDADLADVSSEIMRLLGEVKG